MKINEERKKKYKVSLEDISYEFAKKIIELIKSFPDKQIYWKLGDQLLRSATSIGANIHEAKSAHSRKDFIKFYEISLKSTNETIFWLSLIRDTSLADQNKINLFLVDLNTICKILASSIIKLKQ